MAPRLRKAADLLLALTGRRDPALDERAARAAISVDGVVCVDHIEVRGPAGHRKVGVRVQTEDGADPDDVERRVRRALEEGTGATRVRVEVRQDG
ncbi:MAG TPA: hypothetical protein VM840_08125 [Actinomycetota bacterium]|nr:hypothetical protein [Actinomycetota bacterium]